MERRKVRQMAPRITLLTCSPKQSRTGKLWHRDGYTVPCRIDPDGPEMEVAKMMLDEGFTGSIHDLETVASKATSC